MTSVVVVLAGLAVLRGDGDTSSVLLDYAGRAMMTTGVRTPIDIALYSHYLNRQGEVDNDTARENRARAARMSVSEALATSP